MPAISVCEERLYTHTNTHAQKSYNQTYIFIRNILQFCRFTVGGDLRDRCVVVVIEENESRLWRSNSFMIIALTIQVSVCKYKHSISDTQISGASIKSRHNLFRFSRALYGFNN